MKPYYSHNGIILYHGNCVDILPSIKYDAFVSDPPYGVNIGNTSGSGGKHGLSLSGYSMFSDSYEDWLRLVPPVVSMLVATSVRGAVFTGPHINEQPKASAIGGVYCPSGSGRHTWGFKTFLPVLFYGTAPNLNKGAQPNTIQSTATARKNGHPCPKPLSWMRWLVGIVALPGEIIVDPFAGSGTTLLAAKELGISAIGIELEEKYCEITARRLQQEMLPFGPNQTLVSDGQKRRRTA